MLRTLTKPGLASQQAGLGDGLGDGMSVAADANAQAFAELARGAEDLYRDWREVFSDESGQATTETLLLLGAVVIPLAGGAYMWIDITRHLFSRNAKYLALPFP